MPRGSWLTYYASEFQAVELNFTYYRMPTAEQLANLAAETPEDFQFALKAHQDSKEADLTATEAQAELAL